MDLMDSTTPTRRADVELHIDELVLHGFAARDRHRIAEAVKRELGQLIAQGDLAHRASPIQLDRVDAGSFRLDPAARPSHIGHSVAQSVYRQLSPMVTATPAPNGGRNDV
jgi:hypothetical protein